MEEQAQGLTAEEFYAQLRALAIQKMQNGEDVSAEFRLLGKAIEENIQKMKLEEAQEKTTQVKVEAYVKVHSDAQATAQAIAQAALQCIDSSVDAQIFAQDTLQRISGTQEISDSDGDDDYIDEDDSIGIAEAQGEEAA